MKDSLISPIDVHNELLVSRVHPLDWSNPQPAEWYDLIVIGAGTAGLVVAAGAAGLGIGLKVALIEKHLMGGDCLNVGCVPSKTMIRSSRVVGEMQQARSFGVMPPDPIEVDFAAVMERVRRVRSEISENDSAQRFQELGVDVFLGEGKFLDREQIAVGDQILRFKKAVIATGARASHPDIPGLAEAGFLTNETVFSLTDRPNRLAIIGGGSIGCEMAQTFRRLGCEVTLFHNKNRLLDREDPEAAELLQQVFLKEGIQIVFNSSIDKVEKTNQGKVIHFNSQQITVDEILVGAGRSPNVERLNLDAAGVNYDKKGVKVNDYLQTTNPQIYAAGDICMGWKYTHAADAAARIVIKNAFFSPFGLSRSKLSNLVMPRAIYTDPEIAQVGLSEAPNAEVIKIPLERIDRAIADGETNGFVKILHKKGSDQILGATIVARHAGEMISEITLAIVGKRGLNTLSSVIHPYPTQAEAIRKAADAYRKTLLTPNSQRLLAFLTKLS
ncbi:mercuric reductase [Leptolyngbya sp. FACHB-17]|uniref:mercuric reductase n=1 Tax=unclassified Leptolyngbya TaxID=2650499 RepID=UPI001680A854|nr:mercuric reductase [Leptolyngbya sp. FACHB-17]MBD2080648.1 mercuric reductase [Leptolyngbya sp. FACHB-17]